MERRAGFIKKNWPEEGAHRIRVADEVCRNYFLFDLPWDMERTYEPVIFKKEIDWSYMPGEDPEFIYQMNRHRYFICLGQAYALTGEEKYAACFVRLLQDWIKRVPLTKEAKQTTWRTIEAGLRGEYWTKAFSYFRDCPLLTEEIIEQYKISLGIHADYLLEHFTGFKISSNWGVLESHGLYLIGKELGEEAYCREAIRRLLLEASIQILPDGVHWEQSAMYHNEVLVCFLEILRDCFVRRLPMPKEILDTVEAMALVNLSWKKPDHKQPMYGDSDDTDIRDILTKSAFLLQQGGREGSAALLKSGGFEILDFESVWEFGLEAQTCYEKLIVCQPKWKNCYLTDSGNYFLRSSWQEDADYLHFRNGCHGGGHGHSDKLHMSLMWDGEDVLTDGGRFHYVEGTDRVWFKSALAHNTILVDGQDHMIYTDAWGTGNNRIEERNVPQEKNGMILLEGGHTGYLQKNKNVYLNRKILLLEEGLYLVLDTAYTAESHTYERLFHFAQKDGLSIGTEEITYQGRHTCGKIWMEEHTDICQIASRISRHYNKWEHNTCLSVKTEGNGMTVMAAVFSKGREVLCVEKQKVWSKVPEKYLSEEEALGLHIQRGTREYDIILRKQDMAGDVILLEAGRCMGIGRMMIAGKDGRTTVFF